MTPTALTDWIAPLRRVLAALCLCAAAMQAPAQAADPLSEPTGPVLLTVTGAIAATNADGEARFDRAMLEELGMRRLETANPFEPGIHVFEGPLLRDLLTRVGADGSTLTAKALDGYETDIPMVDPMSYDIVLAMVWNGTQMTVRRKGPIWVVFPIDQNPELNIEEYSSRSIWQLTGLRVW